MKMFLELAEEEYNALKINALDGQRGKQLAATLLGAYIKEGNEIHPGDKLELQDVDKLNAALNIAFSMVAQPQAEKRNTEKPVN